MTEKQSDDIKYTWSPMNDTPEPPDFQERIKNELGPRIIITERRIDDVF